MSILHTPTNQLRSRVKAFHHANLRFVGAASSQEFFIPPHCTNVTLNAGSVMADVAADLGGLTLRISSALPDTHPVTELVLGPGEVRALTDQAGKNVVARIVDGWPEGMSKLYVTLDLGHFASGSAGSGGGKLETETFFLTGEGTFSPTRSGLARVKVVGGGAAGQSVAAQPNLCSFGGCGGPSGGVVEGFLFLEAGVSYRYACGKGGVPNAEGGAPTQATASAFYGPVTLTASRGFTSGTQTEELTVRQVAVNTSVPARIGGQDGGPGIIRGFTYQESGLLNRHGAQNGRGGSSPFGGGGGTLGPSAGSSSDGEDATGYGAGGSGAVISWMQGSPARRGGAGAPGCIEIVMIYDGAGSGITGGKPVVYSHEEFFTGEFWLDGKPIYARVVDLGALPDSRMREIPFDCSGIDAIVSLDTIIKNDLNLSYASIPRTTGTATDVRYIDAWVVVSTNVLRVNTTMDYSLLTGLTTVKYTKKRDFEG